jgi:hypothetical protein
MLGPLAMNGGPTPTMLPLAGSPVLDRGKSFGLTTDQRGYLRPYDDPGLPNAVGGDGSDVGAVESNPTTTAVETPTRAGALGIVGATPMPFRVEVTLAFTLGEAGEVDVSVYSVDGRRVRSLTRGQFEVGTHRVAWDGRDSSGRDAPAGVYFARLRGPQGTSTRTIVRMR